VDDDTVTITVTFSRRAVPARRVEWIRARLVSEIESGAAFVVNAHPDIRVTVDGQVMVPDQRASEADVVGIDALLGGAADGRTTEEIAEAAQLPRVRMFQALSHPRSGLALGSDKRWWPKGQS
jgi:hypothetical protein